MKALESLDKVGILDKAYIRADQLSGGQQQRVAIARALALHPDILCFDEPTSALDPELTGEVLKVLRDLADRKTTMIIVTHEMHFARDVADRILFMDGGVVVEPNSSSTTPGKSVPDSSSHTIQNDPPLSVPDEDTPPSGNAGTGFWSILFQLLKHLAGKH